MSTTKQQQKQLQPEEEKKCNEETFLQILIEHVVANCREDSEHQDIRTLYAALNKGERLQGKILSGGYTNYSYQLYLENNPNFRLFAKLCFSYALWCPGEERKYYDLERQTIEFHLMERFSKEISCDGRAPVATPYLLINVSEDMRILVSQWAPADEQFANQFLEGHVDDRVLPKVAKVLAAITLAKVEDPNMNSTVKQNLSEMLNKPFADEFEKQYQKPTDYDACIAYMNQIGKDYFDNIMQGWSQADLAQECMVHSDTHVFNMLVEGKPNVNALQLFGKNGDLYLCDWEMSHIGALGKDMGLFYSFPLACSYFHAAQGHVDSSNAILEALDTVWQKYADHLKEGGKDEVFIQKSFRNTLGFCGRFIFTAYYTLRKQIEFIDTTGLSPEQVDSIIAQLGVVSLKMMEWAWVNNSTTTKCSLEELKTLFHSTVSKDIQVMVAIHDANTPQRPHRRSSALRATGRRVSDAGMMEVALRRLSLLE